MGDAWWKWRLCYKIKLTITVKTFTRYNDRSRVAAKQTNKQKTDSETGEHLGRKTKKYTCKYTHKQTWSQNTHTER